MAQEEKEEEEVVEEEGEEEVVEEEEEGVEELAEVSSVGSDSDSNRCTRKKQFISSVLVFNLSSFLIARCMWSVKQLTNALCSLLSELI